MGNKIHGRKCIKTRPLFAWNKMRQHFSGESLLILPYCKIKNIRHKRASRATIVAIVSCAHEIRLNKARAKVEPKVVLMSG